MPELENKLAAPEGLRTTDLFGIGSVSDADVESVEDRVGMGAGAWDMVSPKEIIAAAWNRFRSTTCRRSTPESDAVLRHAWAGPGHEVRFGIMARKMRSLERERNAARRDLECANESLPNVRAQATAKPLPAAPC